MWPTDAASLAAVQEELGHATPEPWEPPDRPLLVAGCWICFPRGLTGRDAAGDSAWGAAVVLRDRALVEQQVLTGETGAPYAPGLLALRMGPLVHATVTALHTSPDVLMLDAGSRDHPRRAGLALHAGAVLDLPTIGITHRPLLAKGDWPADHRGATSPVRIGSEVVGCWLRTRAGTRPLVVHPGWATDLDTAVALVLECTVRRTPEPLRRARHLARVSRQEAQPHDAARPRSAGPVRRGVAPRSS